MQTTAGKTVDKKWAMSKKHKSVDIILFYYHNYFLFDNIIMLAVGHVEGLLCMALKKLGQKS